MLKKRIEFLREVINKMIVLENYDKQELLKISQELDKLLLQSIKVRLYSKKIFGEEHIKEFDLIIDKLQLFEKKYQIIRIIDPISKKILEIKEGELSETDSYCNNFREQNEFCENCISMRAFNENDTIFKIEHGGGKIYMVTAIPISIKGRQLVVELLKDAPDRIDTGSQSEESKILNVIKHLNKAAVKED